MDLHWKLLVECTKHFPLTGRRQCDMDFVLLVARMKLIAKRPIATVKNVMWLGSG